MSRLAHTSKIRTPNLADKSGRYCQPVFIQVRNICFVGILEIRFLDSSLVVTSSTVPVIPFSSQLTTVPPYHPYLHLVCVTIAVLYLLDSLWLYIKLKSVDQRLYSHQRARDCHVHFVVPLCCPSYWLCSIGLFNVQLVLHGGDAWEASMPRTVCEWFSDAQGPWPSVHCFQAHSAEAAMMQFGCGNGLYAQGAVIVYARDTHHTRDTRRA